ncbi:MAG TPA: DUF1801 domain-containing protein [Patescibacteria group bacterium]|nr:DUF1801 domain-containing protein [Patescibacteria group bacterium]
MPKPTDFRSYSAGFPPPIRRRLNLMRRTIKKAAPRATEKISYGIPAFTLNGMLVWFAAFKNHIGFYPGAGAISVFKKELSAYKSAKGSVQFPHDARLPLPLITRIVKFRVKQNLDKTQ